jgi:hypothetical protein
MQTLRSHRMSFASESPDCVVAHRSDRLTRPDIMVPKDGDYERLSRPQWPPGYFFVASRNYFREGKRPQTKWFSRGLFLWEKTAIKASHDTTWRPDMQLLSSWVSPRVVLDPSLTMHVPGVEDTHCLGPSHGKARKSSCGEQGPRAAGPDAWREGFPLGTPVGHAHTLSLLACPIALM